MGKQDVKDKTIDPIKALQAGNLTTVQAQQIYEGVFPLGDYKGVASILDLDLLVKQPLVDAEMKHILGNLDGLVEDYSLQTITVGAIVAGVVVTETLAVPTGQVWFINGVQGTCLADLTGTIVYNWRCSLFADPAANPLGGVYHTNWLATPLGPQLDEFSQIAVTFAVGNKPVPLRLPAGTTISGELANAPGAAAATGVVGTFQLFGWIGKALVD